MTVTLARLRPAATLVALTLACIAAVATLAPPAPRPRDAPPTTFSAGRALEHLRVLAAAPRPPGSAAHAAVRAYLEQTLADDGLTVRVQATTWVDSHWTNYDAGYPLRAARVENVIATLPGKSAGLPPIVLVAHYDSKPSTPGAADDGYGTAALLEIARAFAAGPRPVRDVVFVFTDAEELGLFGAAAFVSEDLGKNAAAVINMEARGDAGLGLMFETAGPDLDLARALAGAPRPAASSLARSIYERMPNDTDFTRFRQAGVPGVNLANVAGLSRYHAPSDTVDNASPGTLQQLGDSALAVARRLATRPPGEELLPDHERAVFFDLFSRHLVVYPASWSAFITLAALALVIALAVLLRARGRLAPRAVGLAFGAQLFSLVGVAIASVVLFMILRGLAPQRFSPSAAPAAWTPFAVAFAWLGAAGAATAHAVFATRTRAPDRAVAGLVVWLLVTLLLHAVAPGGAYLFAWPALVAAALGLAALALDQPDASPAAQAAARGLVVLAVLPPLLLVVPMIVHLVHAFGPLAGPGVALLAMLALVPLAPHLAAAALPRHAALPGTLAGASLAFVALAFLRAPFDHAHPRPDTLFAVIDADGATARLVSPDAPPPAYAAAALTAPATLPAFFPLEPSRTFQASAAAAAPPDAPCPDISVDLDGGTGDEHDRLVDVRLRPPAGATILAIYVDGPPGLRSARLDGTRDLALYHRGVALEYFGPPADGVTLRLSGAPGAPIVVRAVSQVPRLPAGAPKRPPGTMAKPSMVLPPYQELMDADATLCTRARTL